MTIMTTITLTVTVSGGGDDDVGRVGGGDDGDDFDLDVDDKSVSRASYVFRLMLLARFLHRPIIHILLPSFFMKFTWLYRVLLDSSLSSG